MIVEIYLSQVYLIFNAHYYLFVSRGFTICTAYNTTLTLILDKE